MIEESKISMKQKEKQIIAYPDSLKGSSNNKRFFDIPNTKFLSLSLPNSANSSPHRASNLTSKQQEIQLMRSKSCREGRARAPSDEFYLWSSNASHANFSRTRAMNENHTNDNDLRRSTEKGFKCNALCLFLPGFGKTKMVKSRKDGSEEIIEGVISRTVSMEKFECDSWASSALFHEIEGGDSMNSPFYDLPMELIKYNANDINATIKSAFVFEKDLKGVLKNSSTSTSAPKSEASTRHVRFSMPSSTSHNASPASCITHNARKTRENFNAFLEAQSA
ncbi:hypothetical protein Lal_00012276 [Lupinus albus]|uniref:Uncharacterized protein n=1 Tax=Lupinus albus TaxID=3870 RepID=A0A6A4QLZ6_LUPAL|nr:hypothetical protein Lalb_Chr05g0229071 [Lupinus albus]KAF1872055.1 hypothetical protein Lal_00012276 [Lupinus albus]